MGLDFPVHWGSARCAKTSRLQAESPPPGTCTFTLCLWPDPPPVIEKAGAWARKRASRTAARGLIRLTRLTFDTPRAVLLGLLHRDGYTVRADGPYRGRANVIRVDVVVCERHAGMSMLEEHDVHVIDLVAGQRPEHI